MSSEFLLKIKVLVYVRNRVLRLCNLNVGSIYNCGCVCQLFRRHGLNEMDNKTGTTILIVYGAVREECGIK